MIKRPFKRKSGYKDARLIGIASEDKYASVQYFEGLAHSDKYKNQRVHVHLIDKISEASSPTHVLKALDSFKKKYELERDDELWVVVDMDRWQLSEVHQLCNQKRYHLAVSNKCFELWLLLHLCDLSIYDQNTLNNFRSLCKHIENELRNILGSYNKHHIHIEDFLPGVEDAIVRARNLGHNGWPNDLGSTVYLLVERIIRN